MINIVKHITGFIFLTIQLEENSVLTEKIGKCDVDTDNQGTRVAKCNNTGIKSIPQDLGENIEVLDISNNSEMTLNKDDLKSYPNVWAFTMMNINVTSIPAGFFQYTKYLRMLNISNTRITDLKEIPSSLVVFNYSRCDLEYVDISQLKNVEKVYLRSCRRLKKVPNIPITAPLKVLDLKYSDLTEANYSQIAPFCLLTYFGFDSEDIKTEQHNYRCCGMKRWSRFHGFEHAGYMYQSCFKGHLGNQMCKELNFTFDEQSVNAYADCIKSIRMKVFLKILGVVILSVLLLGLAGFALYVIIKAKTKSRKQREENIDDSPTDEMEAENDAEATSVDDDG